jgi:7-cyano-7-deazaguanine synthase
MVVGAAYPPDLSSVVRRAIEETLAKTDASGDNACRDAAAHVLGKSPNIFVSFCLFCGQLSPMKVVVLCSGGMDSVTALHWATAHHEVCTALSFDYGARHNHREIPCAVEQAAKLGVPHRIIPLDFIGKLFTSDLLKTGDDIPEGHYADKNMRRTVVPFRNGIMLAAAGGFAESTGAEGLVIAAHTGDHTIYPDCREDFMCAMGDALRLGTYAGIRLLRPFIAMNKSQIAVEGARMGVDFARTWSCYKGGARHCGKCGTCVERREAFEIAGLSDPTIYESTPPLPTKPKKGGEND